MPIGQKIKKSHNTPIFIQNIDNFHQKATSAQKNYIDEAWSMPYDCLLKHRAYQAIATLDSNDCYTKINLQQPLCQSTTLKTDKIILSIYHSFISHSRLSNKNPSDHHANNKSEKRKKRKKL